MNLDYYFPTPVWWTDTTFDNTDLLKLYNDLRTKDPVGAELSNFGGWQSKSFAHNEFNCTLQISDLILNQGSRILSDYGLEPTCHVLEMDNMWFNCNKGKDINQVHIHGGSDFSGVYYLSAPEGSGDIVFYKNYHEEFFTNSLGNNFERITPVSATVAKYPSKNKRLILFPSNLQHGVLPSSTERERISISFNIKVKHV